jgi:hypothetical protein
MKIGAFFEGGARGLREWGKMLQGWSILTFDAVKML